MEKVFEQKIGGGEVWFYTLFVVGDNLYMFLERTIYRWEKEQEKFEPIYTLKKNEYTAEGFVAISDKEVAFQARPGRYLPDDTLVGALTVLNLETMERRTYACQYGRIHKWGENRICVMSGSAKSKTPIMECFDFERNEKRRLMAGALGKAGIYHIYETKAGTILQNSALEYCRVDKLWELMEKCEPEVKHYVI